ncbi:uncharacterized protein BJ171DRAFT_582467 [Polychytrium aggregatum]|uniref:uncharacterized protein n=1 Tax=Polychytrium aggregatum TaxID=110093 RepID=UPI0022FEABF4|nr:uncharacterized protein BJ171DRAFT_582467 [Polychytrium aggregatum]KAI9204089.1 hypothetical protein BJ171DRAFT_582467 [Polychytrium aggregatum]
MKSLPGSPDAAETERPDVRARRAKSVVGGYLLIDNVEGPLKLKALADNAATLPLNRIFISFVRPDLHSSKSFKQL